MAETQIENKTDEIVEARKEKKRQYYLQRYKDNAEELRKKKREYYYANREMILERNKKSRAEKNEAKQRGRPRKYVDNKNAIENDEVDNHPAIET